MVLYDKQALPWLNYQQATDKLTTNTPCSESTRSETYLTTKLETTSFFSLPIKGLMSDFKNSTILGDKHDVFSIIRFFSTRNL